MLDIKNKIQNFKKDSRRITIFVVYLSLLLDNVMLTMVVPIMPDFLMNADKNASHLNETLSSQEYQQSYRGLMFESHSENKSENDNLNYPLNIRIDMNSENGRVGFLLSSKAVVQLFLNPLIGVVTTRVGYHLPMFFGTVILLMSAIMFALGGGYLTMFLARSLQGVGSSCIGITGMCLVAQKYPSEPDRSKMMGFVLGSVALGVLIGYPFGGFMYDYWGKSAPFLIIVILVCFDGALQLCASDLRAVEEKHSQSVGWLKLLTDKKILLTGGAIGISTSTIAILEPCLPIWLLKEIKPKKWQLGTAFIPDSLGYVIGTNSIGIIAYQIGRSKIALPAMILVGLSAFLVPAAKTMLQLVIPHFLLGFGIGAVDAALVPLLASFVDTGYSAHYGTVYAMQQMVVSLAYSLGPVFGSEVSRFIGFPWMMRSIGLINIIFSPFLFFLERFVEEDGTENQQKIVDYHKETISSYQRFSESEESE